MHLSDDILGARAGSWGALFLAVIFIIFFYVILSVAFAMLLGVLGMAEAMGAGGLHALTRPDVLIGALLAVAISHLAIWPAVRIIYKRSYRSLIDPNRLGWNNHLGLGVFLVIAYFGTAEIMSYLPFLPRAELEFVWKPGPWAMWILPMALAILLQVSAEEIAFRGFLQQYLARLIPWRVAFIVIPSLLWALLHIGNIGMPLTDWAAVGSTFALGLVLGDWAHRTGSLAGPILIHFINNFVAICVYGSTLQPTDMQILRSNLDAFEDGQIALVIWLSIPIVLVVYALIRARLRHSLEDGNHSVVSR